jgi:hypothetical protein
MDMKILGTINTDNNAINQALNILFIIMITLSWPVPVLTARPQGTGRDIKTLGTFSKPLKMTSRITINQALIKFLILSSQYAGLTAEFGTRWYRNCYFEITKDSDSEVSTFTLILFYGKRYKPGTGSLLLCMHRKKCWPDISPNKPGFLNIQYRYRILVRPTVISDLPDIRPDTRTLK